MCNTYLLSFDFFQKYLNSSSLSGIVLVSNGVLVVQGPFANALGMHLFMTCFPFFLSGLHFAFRGSFLSSSVIDHTHALTWAQFEWCASECDLRYVCLGNRAIRLCHFSIDRSYFDFSLLLTWDYSNVADEFDVLVEPIYACLAKNWWWMHALYAHLKNTHCTLTIFWEIHTAAV